MAWKGNHILQLFISLLCLFLISPAYSQTYLISNVAGNPRAGDSGEGRLAVNALLYNPVAVYVASSGNIYISDWANDKLKMINSSGIITTIAGTGVFGYSGDGGPATRAKLNGPMGIFVDTRNNIYLADIGNQRIRKIDTAGIITTIAGNGELGFSGDGGLATQAKFDDPAGICGDNSGNIYIADEFNNRIRKIDVNGIITTIAGSDLCGYSGDGGLATSAGLYYPSGVAIDTAGNIFIADEDNNCIRKVDTQGIIYTVVGNGVAGYSGDGGPATQAELYDPASVAVDEQGTIYIADGFNNRIRKINAQGIISTIAGTGKMGYSSGGPAILDSLYDPISIYADVQGNIYFASEFNDDVQKLTPYVSASSFPGVVIYPNPNRGIFTIAIPDFSSNLRLEIYNVLSQKIVDTPLDAAIINMNLSGYANGIYLYRVISSDSHVYGAGKIVIY